MRRLQVVQVQARLAVAPISVVIIRTQRLSPASLKMRNQGFIPDSSFLIDLV